MYRSHAQPFWHTLRERAWGIVHIQRILRCRLDWSWPCTYNWHLKIPKQRPAACACLPRPFLVRCLEGTGHETKHTPGSISPRFVIPHWKAQEYLNGSNSIVLFYLNEGFKFLSEPSCILIIFPLRQCTPLIINLHTTSLQYFGGRGEACFHHHHPPLPWSLLLRVCPLLSEILK